MADSEEDAKSLKDDCFAIDFDVAKSIRYHAYRRSFWDKADFLAKVGTILSGATVLVSLIGEATLVAKIFAFIVAALSAFDIVLGFSAKARTHDGLYRQFSLLAQDITEERQPSEEKLAMWRRRRLEIEMDEPGVIDLLERRCSAEEAIARGCKLREEWRLTKWQIRLSQFAFWPHVPRQQGE